MASLPCGQIHGEMLMLKKCPPTPAETLAMYIQSLFPKYAFYVTATLSTLTLSVSTATAERSLSTLRRLKSYTRDTSTDNRLD